MREGIDALLERRHTRMHARRAILVADLAFGDCGKGVVVDHLTRSYQAGVVVRYNGGPQAGHNVNTPDGKRYHTFSQFGSGTFTPGVRTVLSRFMLVEPYALFNEAAHLRRVGVKDALERLVIDARCVVITPAHQAANRLRELARGEAAHGTCGLGVGEAVSDSTERPETTLRAGELGRGTVVRDKLRVAAEMKLRALSEAIRSLRGVAAARAGIETLEDLSWIDAAVENYAALARWVAIVDGAAIAAIIGGSKETVIFEGAQGVLLDEGFGFHPHTTWSRTTFANADELLDECAFVGLRRRLGVVRTYFTRHGRGPFVTEDPSLAERLPEKHNGGGGWQGRFRVGVLDLVAARYAMNAAGGVDALAVTHMDRIKVLPEHVCTGYRIEGPEAGAEDWFVREGDIITDIRVQPEAGLRERERLTEMLGRCKPVMRPAARAFDGDFRNAFEIELQKGIAIESHGPMSDMQTGTGRL